jgi:hypothetical protein
MPRDDSADASACSPLPLCGQVALRFTFSITRGCLDEVLSLVGLGLGVEPRFGWLGLGAASRRAPSAGYPDASASVGI